MKYQNMYNFWHLKEYESQRCQLVFLWIAVIVIVISLILLAEWNNTQIKDCKDKSETPSESNKTIDAFVYPQLLETDCKKQTTRQSSSIIGNKRQSEIISPSTDNRTILRIQDGNLRFTSSKSSSFILRWLNSIQPVSNKPNITLNLSEVNSIETQVQSINNTGQPITFDLVLKDTKGNQRTQREVIRPTEETSQRLSFPIQINSQTNNNCKNQENINLSCISGLSLQGTTNNNTNIELSKIVWT